MTGAFWAQFFVSNIGGGATSAAVGVVIGFLLRKWIRPLLGGQQEIKSIAQTAVDQSKHAADRATAAAASAGAASDSASTAGDNSRQANEAIMWLADLLADRNQTIDQMRDRIDRLLGTRARELAREHLEKTGALLIPTAAADHGDPVTITGRHSLHTPTAGEPS